MEGAAQKLAILQQLAESVGHDLNNCLGVILGYAEIIVDDTEADTSINQYGTQISEAVGQAKALVNTLLALSRRGKLGVNWGDSDPSIDDVVSAMKAVINPHRGSILLVEQSFPSCGRLNSALTQMGYVVSICDDPQDAIGYVEEDPAAWDLVITDQLMPQMEGTDLVSMIKMRRRDLPCIIRATARSGLTEAAADRAGADGLQTEPLDITAFSALVEKLIARGRVP